jgi:hypothetical protein
MSVNAFSPATHHDDTVARAEFRQQIKAVESKYRDQIQTLQRNVEAYKTALQSAHIEVERLRRQLQTDVAALRDELGIVHGALNTAQAENARMRHRLQQCDAVNKLIQSTIQAESGDRP